LAPSSAGQPWDACTDIEGFTVGDTGKFTAHSAKCNGSIQAWLLKQDNSHPGGTKSQLVLDHLNVRDLRAGEIFSAGPYCTANGREIRWLAIYDWKKRKRISGQTGGIVEAWTVNLKTERFEVAPASLMLRAECTANDSE